MKILYTFCKLTNFHSSKFKSFNQLFSSDNTQPQRKNDTNKYLRAFPEPPVIEIKRDDDWLPRKSAIRHILQDDEEIICREDSSKDEFPDDLFSRKLMSTNFILCLMQDFYFQ